MDTRPADTDYSAPEWSWPSEKFNLPPEALFNDLYDQYNAICIPILEPVAFHHDVSELCNTATTIEEFHTLLRQRRTERVDELRKCWDAISIRIACHPPLLVGDKDEALTAQRWSAFLRFSREFSFDALASYFGMFTHSTSPAKSPPPADEPANQIHTSEKSSTPTQTRERAFSSSTSIGDEVLRPDKRFRGEPEVSKRTDQIGKPPSTDPSPVITQSRKRAFASTSSIHHDEDNERLRPVKKLRGDKRIPSSTKQSLGLEMKAASSTATHSTTKPEYRRSCRLKTGARATCSKPRKVSNRNPTPPQLIKTYPRRSSRIKALAQTAHSGPLGVWSRIPTTMSSNNEHLQRNSCGQLRRGRPRS